MIYHRQVGNDVVLDYVLEFGDTADLNIGELKQRTVGRAEEFPDAGLKIDENTPQFYVPGEL